MESLYHLFKLTDTNVSVEGIGRIRALGYVIVSGIIAPVIFTLFGMSLVNRVKIIYGVKMNVGNSELFKIINAGRKLALAVYGSTFSVKARYLPLFFSDTPEVSLPEKSPTCTSQITASVGFLT